jgi:hypothetical protein
VSTSTTPSLVTTTSAFASFALADEGVDILGDFLEFGLVAGDRVRGVRDERGEREQRE